MKNNFVIISNTLNYSSIRYLLLFNFQIVISPCLSLKQAMGIIKNKITIHNMLKIDFILLKNQKGF